MKLIIFAFILLVCGYSYGKLYSVKDCGKVSVPQGRIVDGKVAYRGKYPWMVSIHEKDDGKFGQICGGSILNENWIVTAAHCFNLSISLDNYELYVGLFSILKKKESTVQTRKISELIIHEHYNEEGLANDIALVKTSAPMDIKGSKGYVNAICLPTGATNPSGEATVTGWGLIKANGSLSAELREVTVPIVPWQKCKDIYGAKDSDFEYVQVVPHMLCAGGNGKDSCQADSGGPLIQYDNKGIATLIGTVANGGDCGYGHYPGMYMKVSAFTSWMDKKMT